MLLFFVFHLQIISNDIRRLDQTIDQHRRLIQETQEMYPGVPLAVSIVLPRYVKEQCGNDHDYALTTTSANLLEHLNIRAAKTFHDVVSQYLPVPAQDERVYIANTSLTMCTCLSLIHKGQLYLL